MTEARIGRLLAASLHQAIAERLPQRLEFYEEWLTSEGLRDGSIGLAPMTAVIGFLRTEGAAYDAVVGRAGQLAADWTFLALPPYRRRAIGWLPRTLRARAALNVAADIVRSLGAQSEATSRLRRNRARFEVRPSVFCAVRGVSPAPLCGFYLTMAIETLRRFDVAAAGRVEQCRAVGAGTCVLVIELAGAVLAGEPAIAA
jgi:hypothetical protein